MVERRLIVRRKAGVGGQQRWLRVIRQLWTRCRMSVLRKKTQQPREPLPSDMMTFEPEIEFQLVEKIFGKNLRSSKRGVAGGPSGMTTEHVRPLLDDAHSTHLFFRMGENLARAQGPEVAVAAVRSGRMTALSKDDGGVRGIVTGDVASTIAQQLTQQSRQPQRPINMHSPPRPGVSALLMPSRLCAD